MRKRTGPKPGFRGTLIERIERRTIRDALSGCWVYTGPRQRLRDGTPSYGVIGVGTGKSGLVHRAAYEVLVGPIPKDRELHHRCCNRACWNPEHLEAVTRWIHVHVEPASMANRTHCKRGHPLTTDNLVPSRLKKGVRQCRTCVHLSARTSYMKNKEKKRAYAATNRERINAGQRRRYAADPERFIDYQREWKAKRKHV